MKWSLFLILVTAVFGADGPRILYSKSFPGSSPAFVATTVEKTGAVEFRDTPAEENPVRFKLTEAEVAEIFALAEKLDWFRRPLESPLKVAFTGAKSFRYENGAEKSEVKFNFTEDAAGRAIGDWFERITESAELNITLERAAKYDKLGVFKALLQLEATMDRKRLVGAVQFLPMLDRIVKNETYMHTARTRAAGIAEAIRAAQP